jgi:uncharacterized membrane protein YkoI
MRARLTKLGAALTALAALAIGGSALATAAGSGSQPAKAPAVMQQDSAKADAANNEPAEKGDTDSIQDVNGADDATEAAEREGAEANDADQSPAYRSSITAPEQEGVGEEAEASALQAKATVTAVQAKSAALSAVPGTAGQVELDNENGNVVYSVEITKADGTVVDVKIDAGNAKVVHQDSGDDEQSDAPEQPRN